MVPDDICTLNIWPDVALNKNDVASGQVTFLLSISREAALPATSVPLNTPEELYNLTIIIEKNAEIELCNRQRAVSVINKFSDNFSFIHITDLHIGDLKSGVLELNKIY